MLSHASQLALIATLLFAGSTVGSRQSSLDAQVLPPTLQPVATLQDQLVNRLRATTPERRAFIGEVLKKVDEGKLDRKLVLAVQRYAVRKNPQFPFPYFERAIRFLAEKRGVSLPQVQSFVGPSTGLSAIGL